MATELGKRERAATSARKKWNLEDRTSLNNLKYHIAAEGCSDVQYGLAKDLLDLDEDGHISPSNQQQAVHWLICAGQQGHEEAINLLQECYKRNCGITPDNEPDVRCCLSMTPGERAARKAARELFSCLSNGNEHITPKQLERKMRKIYNLQKRRRRRGESTSTSEDEESGDDNAIESNKDDRPSADERLQCENDTRTDTDQNRSVITEENLVSAAVNYAAGRLPSMNDALVYSVPHPSSLDHMSRFRRVFQHPVIFLTILYHRLINFISAIPTQIPSNIRILLLFLIYWMLSSENSVSMIPIAFYYGCLIVMVWSTCKMLKSKQDFIDFRIWSGLFLRYGDHNIEADISENRFLKNNMKPYLYFFCAFVSSFIVYPFIVEHKEWLCHSEITIISCMLVFITLFVFMYSSPYRLPDWIILISFGVNVLAKYPYEMDTVVSTRWRFLDLKIPSFSSFVIGNGIEFCLNSRTAFYLLIPGFLIHLARRSRWHGTYIYLIPHCVTLSWLQLCITTAQSGATMFGVVRGTLGLAGILLFLPLFGIVSLLIPVFVAVDWMGLTDPSVRWLNTLVVGAITLTGSCFLALNRATQKYVTTVQVLLCIIAASVLTYPYMTSMNGYNDEVSPLYKADPTERHDPNHDNLSWAKFFQICSESSWEGHNNKIKTQMLCAHLEGLRVSWDGVVSQVQIVHVSNVRAKFINKYLPLWLAKLITCIYGERSNNFEDCGVDSNDWCFEQVQYMTKNSALKRKCHLHRWDQYEYEIHIKMPGRMLTKSATVILQAAHNFGNMTQHLAAGDRLLFRGTLQNHRQLQNGERQEYILGSGYPVVRLTAAKCLSCRNKNIPIIVLENESAVNARLQDIMRGIKYLLNVLFNPLITFK